MREGLLVWGHGVAVFNLESRVVEIEAPEDVVKDQPRVLVHRSYLIPRDDKAEVNVDHSNQ